MFPEEVVPDIDVLLLDLGLSSADLCPAVCKLPEEVFLDGNHDHLLLTLEFSGIVF